VVERGLLEEVWERERLKPRLQSLSPMHRIAFAAACAERTLWRYLTWAKQEGKPSSGQEMHDIVQELWAEIDLGSLNGIKLKKAAARCEELIPNPDEEPVEPGADNAAFAVLYALQCAISGGQVTDALDAAEKSYRSWWTTETLQDDQVIDDPELLRRERSSPQLRKEVDFQMAVLKRLEAAEKPTHDLLSGL
jgi:uncharacterized protein YjaG (DUF416 family)